MINIKIICKRSLLISIMALINESSNTNYQPVFCTLFNISNEHLTKDLGLIPYGMHIFEGYDSFIATYINGDYPNLKYTTGLRIEEVPKLSGDWIKDSCAWLRKNANRIDVLNLYHVRNRSLKHILAYKLSNPKGKVYLKMDGCTYPRSMWRFWRNIKPKLILKLCKCVSTEFQENAEKLSHSWKNRIIWVSNPSNPKEIQDFRPFSERSNTILTVGRQGTKQKATEILLEAFARISGKIPDWKLKLAGYIAENMNIASDFYAKYPELKERVAFTGEIRDRNILVEAYRDAKIFAFPSR